MNDKLALRSEGQDDSEFIYELFASTRADEMAVTGWSEDAKEAFLRSQLALQTHHYHTHFPKSSFDIILESGAKVGRLYVERGTNAITIHDIALIPSARGRGLGTYFITQIANEADAAAKPLQIYVEQNNPAMNLYLRLGFAPDKQEGIYNLMQRLPQSHEPQNPR